MAGYGEPRQSVGDGNLSSHRARMYPDARWYRLHLGQRYASLVQARQELRGIPRRRELPPRTLDAALGSLTMSNASEAEVRAEVRTWLKDNWDPQMRLVEWRNLLADSGWGMPQWPKRWYGRDLPVALVRAVEEEFAALGAVGAAGTGVRLLAAATLLEHASDYVK